MVQFIPLFMSVFFLTVILAVLMLPLLKKIKASQTILHYVKEHSSKQGTPTMGGLIFIASILIIFIAFGGIARHKYAAVVLSIAAGYGVVGFLDDFIKIYFKRNLGLRAYQKMVFQLIVAAITAAFVQANGITSLQIPFTRAFVDTGFFTVPLTVLAVIATTNCVNLTDGLDGLASGTSVVTLTALAALIFAKSHYLSLLGDSLLSSEMLGITKLLVTAAGAIFAFLCFNSHPARIFMGDTGSMALGAFIAVSAVFSGYTLFIPLLAIMPVISGLSVILQVASFKMFKKRIILMAPYHHHLQQLGIGESKISFMYAAITLILCLCLIFFSIL